MQSYAIAIHGGAGTIRRARMTPDREAAFRAALAEALQIGTKVLEEGGAALDAVEQAVRSMEDCPLFNAGRGSVFTATGGFEMDAAIMDGKDLMAGAVTGVSGVKNPVSLARLVPQLTPHVFLSGHGAYEFAQRAGCELAEDAYFFDVYRHAQWLRVKGKESVHLDHTEDLEEGGEGRKFGTVGAVAKDRYGNLAAATSTGGMTNKRFGRIGDSPIIGIGTYANNKTCAVSCTGHGEPFIRAVAAYDLSCLMEYMGLPLEAAAKVLVHEKLPMMGAEGGLIAVDAQGNLALPFNAEGMYRAWKQEGSPGEIAIYQ